MGDNSIWEVLRFYSNWNNIKNFDEIISKFSKDIQEVNKEIMLSISQKGLVGWALEGGPLYGVVVKRELEVPISLYWGLYGVFPVLAERPWAGAFQLFKQSNWKEIEDRFKNAILCVSVIDEGLSLEKTEVFPDYTDFDPETGEYFNKPVGFDQYERYEDIPFSEIAHRPISFEYSVKGGKIPFNKISYILVPEHLYELARKVF